MNAEQFLKEAQALQGELVEKRHYIHSHAETGFDLCNTVNFVKEALSAMGYEPQDCGKSGIVVTVGGKKQGRVFLVRGDMDALPFPEQSEVDFASDNGNAHACGHDMHTTMLLGAAKLLKMHEDEIEGTIKLMFQPAEEIFEGAHDMIEAGVLKNPDVDAALMIHVMAGQPFEPGTVIVSSGGISAPGADYFNIHVQGVGCHGSMPNTGVDPINIAAHIITALQEIQTRELALVDEAVLTFGQIHAGQAANAVPDVVDMEGTIRTYDEDVRTFIKERMTQISTGIASAFRGTATVDFYRGCPVLKNDYDLSDCSATYVKELLGPAKALTQKQLLAMAGDAKPSKSAGSEDFAFVSQEVPSIMLALAAGNPQGGYSFPQHHPKVKFDDSVLASGSAVYAYTAMRWLEDHK